MLTAFTYTGSIQSYLVPVTGEYALSVAGAQGGNYSSGSGGLGAVLSGDVMLTAGTTVKIVVGGRGGTSGSSVGGGGGSFVYTSTSGGAEPLIAAGGGGGSGTELDTPTPARNASTTTSGFMAPGATGGQGGTNGTGGLAGHDDSEQTPTGGGGGGWFEAGENSQVAGGGDGAPDFVGGRYAGTPVGGFGGGGAGGTDGGGGGGGYSGGGGGSSLQSGGNGFSGGGGGSYSGTSVTNTTSAVTRTGDGSVTISGLLTANNQAISVAFATPKPVVLAGVDAAVPGATLTYGIATQGAHGIVSSLNPKTGTVSYTPNDSYVGPDSFTFIVTDGTTTATGTVDITVASPSTTPWLSTLPDSLPLTDASLPGTINSAAGPDLANALLGSGSVKFLNSPSFTNTATTNAALVAHLAADAASSAAIAADGTNPALNAAAVAANAAALAADAAAGITAQSTGTALALALTADTAGLTSAIASAAQAAKAASDATADATSQAAGATATAGDTAAGAALTAAGTAGDAATNEDAAASIANAAAGTSNAAASGADDAAGVANTAAGVADAAAGASDVAAAVQGAIDPVADGIAAGLDTAATVTDVSADGTDVAATAADAAAGVTDGAAIAADTLAVAGGKAAVAANTAAAAPATAAAASSGAAAAPYGAAGTSHTVAAAADATAAAAFVAGAASDGYTGNQFQSFADNLYSPDTEGGNPNNAAGQAAIHALAVAEAATHLSASTLEALAALANSAAATANGTAAALDAALVSALEAAMAANQTAVSDNLLANSLTIASNAANSAAATADEAAAAANSTAGALDATAGGLNTTAGIADGVSAGLDTGAAVADTAAIAADALALATVEIPFVDIATAIAAAAADVAAAVVDATATASDAATAVTDGLASAGDVAAVTADAAVTAVDKAAVVADATASADSLAANLARNTAHDADFNAVRADAALLIAIKAADAANKVADTADAAANKADGAALAAIDSSIAADISFSGKVQAIQTTQVAQTTQTLAIADQLSAGIRALDLRGALVGDTINLNVGSNFSGTTLQSALDDMTSFLKTNSSETIVVTLSAGTNPINSPNGFNADLNKLLNSSDAAVSGQTYKSFVYYSPNAATTPTLGQVRGKIVFVPSTDKTWTPVADPTTGLQIGWQPTVAVGTSTGLVATDLGTPATLYVSNLTADNDTNPVADGDTADALAQTYFGQIQVTRTTGIVGMDDPSQNLINEIVGENHTPIIVTSDSDAPGAAGTLRAAILEANALPGVNTIQFANSLTGSTGNVIVLQSDLPPVTNNLNLIGGPTIDINLNGFAGPAASGTTHTVTVANFPTSATQTTLATSVHSTGLYVNIEGLNYGNTAPLSINAINITYGSALANTQLAGTATAVQNGVNVTIAGTFTFTSAAGTVLKAGNGQSEAVTFTPAANTFGYTKQTGTVIVNVARATPTVTSVNAVNITYGIALANSQLSGAATYLVNGKAVSVPGTYVFASAAGTVLNASSKGQALAVTFNPSDTTDFTTVASTVTANVAQSKPTVTVNPVNLVPGDTLNDAQLVGTATAVVNGTTVSIAGTFGYKNASGTVVGNVTGQVTQVVFTPNDTTDFATVTTSTVVSTAETTPVAPRVTVSPINLTYGTALSDGQISGIATFNFGGTDVNVPGTFSFDTAGGSVLSAGESQNEGVTFAPTDTVDYTPVSTTVTVDVARATPVISSLGPVAVTYGAVLSDGQLSGTATAVISGQTVNVPGTFAFTSAAGSIVGAGQGQSEAVTFTPTDTTNFTTVSTAAVLNVARTTATVTGVNTVGLTYGTPLANGQLAGTAVAIINGSSTPVAGTFTYVAAGSILNAGNGQTAAVVFTPNDTTDFTTVSSSVTLNITPATPTVTVTDAGGVANGSAYAAAGTVTGVNNASLGTPTFAYYVATDTTFANPLTGAPTASGRYVVVGSSAASGNYAAGVGMVGFTINNGTVPVTATITTAAQPATANVGAAIADQATVTGANPTGVVTFRLYNNPTATGRSLFSDSEMLVNGVATSRTYTTTSNAIGTDYWVATYTGDGSNNPVTSSVAADVVTVGASLVVNSIGDGPAATGNTLRDAVAYADTLGPGTHAITFDPTVFATGQTISLGSALGALVLSDTSGTTAITGPAAGVTINGGGSVGLFVVNSGVTATLSGLTLINGAAAQGGAINDKGSLTLDHSLLQGNTASQLGGAIVVTGGLTVVDSTFAANTATLSGGAIEDAGSVTVLDSTLAGNTVIAAGSGNGGAIDNGASAYTLKVGDSIFSGNSAANGPDVSNAVTSLGNNLVHEIDGGSGWVGTDLTGTVAGPLRTLLLPLANNGGPSQTFALADGSPAIGAGAPLPGVDTDQRGLGRPANRPDIGAYQTEAVVTVTDPGGTFNGGPFPATSVTATGTGGLNISNFADFTFLYAGTSSTTYPASSAPPINPGTYTVVATYLGDANHAAVSSTPTPFEIQAAVSVTPVTDLTFTRSGFVYNARAGTYTQTLKIYNPGPSLSGALSLIFTNTSGAKLSKATGTTQLAHGGAPAGSAYVTLPSTMLAADNSVTITLTFSGIGAPTYNLFALLGSGVL